MRPVTQRRTGAPQGQCVEASIASILECTLEEVPDLLDPAVPGDRSETFPALLDWLWSRGRIYVSVQLGAARPLPLALPRDLPVSDDTQLWHLGWDGYHLLYGVQPGTGLGHACVGHAGELVWDPNPGRWGLATVDEVVLLVPRAVLPVGWTDRAYQWTAP